MFRAKGIRRATRGSKRPSKRSKPKKRAKTTEADLKRQWGVPVKTQLRYKGIKGIMWYWTSISVRQRDMELFNGECIDMCGKFAENWWDFDAGHFIPASNCGFGLLFDRKNLHGQLKACNNPRFSPHSPIGYALGLDKRYGAGTAAALFKRKGEKTKEWKKEEYAKQIKLLPAYQASLQ